MKNNKLLFLMMSLLTIFLLVSNIHSRNLKKLDKDTIIQEIPCKAGTFIKFHENKKIKYCILSKNY